MLLDTKGLYDNNYIKNLNNITNAGGLSNNSASNPNQAKIAQKAFDKNMSFVSKQIKDKRLSNKVGVRNKQSKKGTDQVWNSSNISISEASLSPRQRAKRNQTIKQKFLSTNSSGLSMDRKSMNNLHHKNNNQDINIMQIYSNQAQSLQTTNNTSQKKFLKQNDGSDLTSSLPKLPI